METVLAIREVDSPIGKLVLGGEEEKLFFIEHGSITDKKNWMEKWMKRYRPSSNLHTDTQAFQQAKEELDSYFSGQSKSFSAPVKLIGTSFQERVWNALLSIPYGQTVTYKDIAEEIGQPKAVRAVGGAINKNPISIIVPCHRVIGSNKKLTGYRGGLDRKEKLLAIEQDELV